MKTWIYPLTIAAVIGLSAFTAYKSVHYTIAEGHSVQFLSKDPSGVFEVLKGDIHFDPENLAASKFDVSVETASINTGNGMQNKHAMSAKWMDAELYPLITFKSTEVSKAATDYTTKGILGLHGVEKEISIPFSFKDNTFTGGFEVNRNDYKIGKPGGAADDVLQIKLSVPVKPQ